MNKYVDVVTYYYCYYFLSLPMQITLIINGGIINIYSMD